MASGQGKSAEVYPWVLPKVKPSRIYELDFFRGIAVILMISYHVVWDLSQYTSLPVNHNSLFWSIIGKVSAFLFIFIAGVCSSFSDNPIYRGLKILGCGFILTGITYVIMPDQFIRFGILHFLGLCILCSPVFQTLKQGTLLGLGILSLLFGVHVKELNLAHNYFLPLGLTSSSFESIDYFPIFPYLSYFLLGIVGNRLIWSKGKTLLLKRKCWDWIGALGKRSLLIYFVHQPVILGTIQCIKMIKDVY